MPNQRRSINWGEYTPTFNPETGERVAIIGPDGVDWRLIWFQHCTRRIDLSDAELYASFDRFTRWFAHYQDPLVWIQYDDVPSLMGAQDRWRWSKVCRCEQCTAQGVVRIDH